MSGRLGEWHISVSQVSSTGISCARSIIISLSLVNFSVAGEGPNGSRIDMHTMPFTIGVSIIEIGVRRELVGALRQCLFIEIDGCCRILEF